MRAFLIFLVVVCVIVAGAVAGLMYVPLDTFRAPLERAASNALGRDVLIKGALHASLYPEIGLSAEDVSIANVANGEATEFARVKDLAVGAKLIPLLSRDIQITKLTLVGPAIHLEVAKDGSPNWNLQPAKTDENNDKNGADKTAALRDARLSISGFKISDGEISYFDARTGKRKTLSKANMSLSMTALDQPAELTLDAIFNKEKLNVTAHIDSPNTYLNQMPTKVTLALKSRLTNLDFDGTVVAANQHNGALKVTGPSLRGLMQWTGTPVPKAPGLGKFSLSGNVAVKDQIYSLKRARVALDGMNASADMSVNLTGNVPAVSGNLTLDKLDLGTYMTANANAGTNANPADEKKGKGGKTKGWSTEPLALGGLKLANADVGVAIDTLTLGELTVSHSRMKVSLHGGRLSADLNQAGLFNGNATGSIVADARSSAPDFAMKLNVSNVQMKPLLGVAMKVDRIEGTGALSFDVEGRGRNQQAIMDSLSGSGNAQVRNGALRGVDLAAVARSVEGALSGALGAATGEKASTDFAELGGTFTIANGVLHNSDFRMLNPFVRLSGDGDVNLGQRTIDFHVEPRAVTSREGQGGKADAGGIGVPFHVSGAWDNLHYQLDTKRLVSGVVDQIVNGKGGGIGGLLGNLLGGKNKTNPAGSNTPQNNDGKKKKDKGLNTKDLLNGLLGR